MVVAESSVAVTGSGISIPPVCPSIHEYSLVVDFVWSSHIVWLSQMRVYLWIDFRDICFIWPVVSWEGSLRIKLIAGVSSITY